MSAAAVAWGLVELEGGRKQSFGVEGGLEGKRGQSFGVEGGLEGKRGQSFGVEGGQRWTGQAGPHSLRAAVYTTMASEYFVSLTRKKHKRLENKERNSNE